MLRSAASLLVLCFAVAAQSLAPARAFEVASVRQHEGPISRIGFTDSGPRLTGTATVTGLILYAFHLKNYQISCNEAALKEVGDTFFDVAAKAEGDTAPSSAEFRQMMRSLLAERFRFKFHRESRETPVYALVVGKNGPRFQPSTVDADPSSRVFVSGPNYQITMPKATVADFIDLLDNSAFVDRPIVNQTGLTGSYDLKLTYTPDIRSRGTSEADPNDLPIFSALQSQLGLKLESQKAMMEILVVDHVEKPSGN